MNWGEGPVIRIPVEPGKKEKESPEPARLVRVEMEGKKGMVARAWVFPEEVPQDQVQDLARRLRVPPLVARTLIRRGLSDPGAASRFLDPALDNLHDPDLFRDMEKACRRIHKAVVDGEPILIHGDYDADGITSTALLLKLLRFLGARADWHIPNRITEGFSFSPAVLERVKKEGFRLCVTVDNGTSAVREISGLAARGCQVIVTDHHEPGPELPPALAMINPKLQGCTYPFQGLAGVGVAFKLAWGLARVFSGSRRVSPPLRRFLMRAMGWTALGTVADVVPLLEENRVFLRHGLPILSRDPGPGLSALMEICNLSGREITARDVAFRLAPRINAAGRMGSAEKALRLLLAGSREEALPLALELDQANRARRAVEQRILREAREILSARPDLAEAPILLLAREGWHVGVVGIVAARLCEELGKPVALCALGKDQARGSARSPEGFPIHLALARAEDLLLSHGGHARAAGLAFDPALLEALQERLARVGEEMGRSVPPLYLDARVNLGELTPDVVEALRKLGPHGSENPPPLFAGCGLVVAGHPRVTGYGGKDLSFLVRQGEVVLEARAPMGAGPLAGRIARGMKLSLAFTPGIARERRQVEILVKDVQENIPQEIRVQ